MTLPVAQSQGRDDTPAWADCSETPVLPWIQAAFGRPVHSGALARVVGSLRPVDPWKEAVRSLGSASPSQLVLACLWLPSALQSATLCRFLVSQAAEGSVKKTSQRAPAAETSPRMLSISGQLL